MLENIPEYQPLLQQALSLLHTGDARKAFQTFRPVLSYPGMVEQSVEFSETLQVLAEISVQIGESQFAGSLHTAARSPTDVKQLYHVGFEMIEHGLRDMAATVLAYAHHLEPSNAAVLQPTRQRDTGLAHVSSSWPDPLEPCYLLDQKSTCVR